MAQFANGKLRFVVKHRDGSIKERTDPIPYDQLDNTSSPFTFFSYNGRQIGAADDDWTEVLPPGFVAVGAKGEYIDVEFYHTAAMTPDTSAFTLDFNFLEFTRETPQGVGKPIELDDRHTRDGAGSSIPHPNGWQDDLATVPREWTPLLRFIPEAGVNYSLHGRQNLTVDGA